MEEGLAVAKRSFFKTAKEPPLARQPKKRARKRRRTKYYWKPRPQPGQTNAPVEDVLFAHTPRHVKKRKTSVKSKAEDRLPRPARASADFLEELAELRRLHVKRVEKMKEGRV